MVTAYEGGNKIKFDKTKGWIFVEDGLPIHSVNKPCPECGHPMTKYGHDPCIANLPGVKNACCGHGDQEGYIMFENGVTIRGYFKIEHEINEVRHAY